jgi:amylosucrase
MAVIGAGNPHVFGYVREGQGQRVLALANFSERDQTVDANVLRTQGVSYAFRDLTTGERITLGADLTLPPYGFVWLAPE